MAGWRLLPLVLAACTDVFSVRTGPLVAARPETCELELVDANPNAAPPEGFELVGYVSLLQKKGVPPDDPAVLRELKPEACKLGGHQVSVAASANATNGLPVGSYHTFAVWHRKEPQPKKPVKF